MDHKDVDRTYAVERYWLGELPRGEREEFEEHFFACDDCADALRHLEILEANGLDAGVKGVQDKVVPIERKFRFFKNISLLAAALLAGVVGFDHLVEIPRFQNQIATLSSIQVVEPPVGLHAEQRGADEATVSVLKGAAFFDINFDVAKPSGTGYDCVIQSAAGVRVDESRNLQAPLGEFHLRLAAKNLEPGEYVLVLLKSGSREELGRYRFRFAWKTGLQG
jgi:Putative zinc-finger